MLRLASAQCECLLLAEKVARLHRLFLMNIQITCVSSFLLIVVFLHGLSAGAF